jgi:Putative DNA-binding domain
MCMPFVIFPSESVLIGLAEGEFIRLHELGKDDRFEDVLVRRLHPFIPDLTEEVKTNITEPEGLDAISWYSDADGEERGVIGSRFNVALLVKELNGEKPTDDEVREDQRQVNAFNRSKAKLDAWLDNQPSIETLIGFARRGNEYYRVDMDYSRKSLLDLLIEYLTAEDPVPRKRWSERQALREHWGIAPKPKKRHRTPDEIQCKIDRLIQHNKTETTFNSGKLLGRAFGDCVVTDAILRHMEDQFYKTPEQWRSVSEEELPEDCHSTTSMEHSWRELLDALAKDDLFLSLEVGARGLLDRLRTGKFLLTSGFIGSEDSDEGVLNAAFCMRTGLSLLLGYALGALRPKDAEAINRDKRNPIPRDFLTDDPAQCLATTLLIKKWGKELETLCKLLWPDTHLEGMTTRLQQSMNRGSHNERSFAKTALRLMKTYQDAKDGEPGMFARCRVRDEVHFVDGMPQLHRLAQIILNERSHARSDVHDLIKRGESQFVEFKSSGHWDMKLNNKNETLTFEVVSTVAAFLNSNGGTLLIGIADDGKPIGLEKDYKLCGQRQDRDGYEQWLRGRLSKHLRKAMMEFVGVDFEIVEGVEICRVTVKHAPKECYLRVGDNKEFWVRIGNAKNRLDVEESVEYIKNHWK